VTDRSLSPRQRVLAQLAAEEESRRSPTPQTRRAPSTQNVDALLPLYVVARGQNPDDLEDHVNACAADGYEVVPGSVAIRPGTIVCVMQLLPLEEEEPAPAPAPSAAPVAESTSAES
jgi:hypothetical protein